jgi:flagellar biosynthesis anti-sigma factor FlgM
MPHIGPPVKQNIKVFGGISDKNNRKISAGVFPGRKRVMKISDNNPPKKKNFCGRIDKVRGKEDILTPSHQGVSGPKVSNNIRLSGRTRELEELQNKMNEVADMRVDLVNELRKAVQDGTYQVDPHKIAGRIISEII